MLFVRLSDPPQVDAPTFVGGKAPQEKGYKLTLRGQRAIFHDASREPPADVVDQPRLTEKHRGDMYVTPCGGVLDHCTGVDQVTQARNDALLTNVLTSVQERVAERHNVTIINRATQQAAHSEFFDTLAISVLNAVAGSAERALQIVADEQAKEKQMQRLLQSDEEVSSPQQIAPRPPSFFRSSNEPSVKKALGLSPPVQLKLRSMSAQRARSPHAMRSSSARSRFTLLAASSEAELRPPSEYSVEGLLPRAFIAHPPDAACAAMTASSARRPTTQQSDGVNSQTKVSQRRQTQTAKRRATVAMLERLSVADDPSTIQKIKGNGWGSELRYFAFNGTNSVIGLPPIPKFEEFIKSFTIDFWIKTDCRMSDGKRNLIHVMEGQRAEVGMNFQIGLNFYSDFDEHLRIYMRDAGNRVMEVLAPLPSSFATGHDFRHVMIRIKNLESGKVEVAFDGEPCDRLRYVQQEHPVSFNAWPHNRVYIGSYVDDSNTVQQCLRGGICELRFWRGASTQPMQRWPLLGDRNSIGKLAEATKSVPEDHQETLIDLRESIHQPPEVCPFFDGNCVLNMGPLGIFGELLNSWSVEIRFKTSITGRSMSLMGVTDSQQKMSEIGIVLNAEPVLSRERYRYHEHHITCFLVDCWGACCSALIRGTERQNVADGQWHTIQWKITDSENNKFEVRIDGVSQDLLLVYREGPSSFCPFRDFVCVGAHNVRNWKLRNVFTGAIKSVAVSVRGEPLATLALNEGPGATMAQDSSGHHNHALITNAEDQNLRRHDLLWVPCQDNAVSGNEAGASLETASSNIVIHKNNQVSIAVIRFSGMFDSGGTIQESLTDMMTQKPFDLLVTDQLASSAKRRDHWDHWRAIPPEVFHSVENGAQLKEMGPSMIKLHDRTGHFLLILRIGDCHISVLDLLGPLVPMQATFDCNMMKWKYAIAINGTKGKKEQLLNNYVVGLEKMLIEVSSNPNLTAKLSLVNQETKAVTADDIVKSLTASGIAWRLSLTMHSLLLNAEYGAHLYVFYSCHRICPEEEAASIAVVSRAIQKAAEARAAIIIQRNWRGKVARHYVMSLEDQRKLRKQQVEEIMSLRRANPLVQPKKNLRAIVICAHEFSTDVLPPITFNTSEVVDGLKKQGYAVELIKNPARSAINKAIGSIEPDSCTLLYISGYGGALRVRQPAMMSPHRLHLSITEGCVRASLELETTLEFKQISKEFFAGYQDVLHAEAAKAAKKQKKAPSKNAAAQAQQQRHIEESFRVSREELLKDENEARTLKLQKEYEAEVAIIQKELRQVINATQDFEETFRPKADGSPVTFFIPSDCRSVEPFGSEVFNVDDLIYRALQRQLPPMGFQAIVAVDLVPLIPGTCGLGILASSTGHTLTFPYQPEQRHILSWHLRKALLGYMPKIPVKNREAILQGAVETPDTQRDWRSFASYVTHKMIDSCDIKGSIDLMKSLSQEMPYSADLVPIRSIIANSEMKDKVRRELETRRGQATVVFAVDSLKVTSDMNGEFKSFLQHVTINETINLNTILLSFLDRNHGIDGVRVDAVSAEVERCAPNNAQDVKYQITVSSQGVFIAFTVGQNGDKQKMQQWINLIAARSISWRIPTMPFSAKKDVEVERIEMLFAVKTAGNFRKLKQLQKQRLMHPLPYPTIRFFSVTME